MCENTMLTLQVIIHGVLAHQRRENNRMKNEKAKEQGQGSIDDINDNTNNGYINNGNNGSANNDSNNDDSVINSDSAVLMIAQEVTQASPFDPDHDCYLEMVLHYAFLTLFSLSCPAVPVLSLLR